MAAKRVDITIFGANGFMGKCVLAEFLLSNHIPQSSWAIAGQNKETLSELRDWASKRTGRDLSEVPIVTAECNDQESLDIMLKRTRVVINCCAPYSHCGESVRGACDRNDAFLVDIVKEPNVSELVSVAQEMVKMKKSEELDRTFRRKKSPVATTSKESQDEGSGKESHDEVSGDPEQKRKKFCVRRAPLKKSHDEESDHPERREESTRNSPDVELDHLGGHKESPFVHVLLAVLLVFCIVYDLGSLLPKKESNLLARNELNIISTLKPLASKFPSQHKNLRRQIYTGFQNLMRSPVSPAIYLLPSDRKSERTSSCVAEMITSFANRILPNNEDWLFLNGSALSNATSGDSDVLLKTIADGMYFSKVVLVSDIDKIPGHLAAGFHFLVEQERDAVYLFTMTINEMGNATQPVLNYIAKTTLIDSWSDINPCILYPLVTRLTQSVLLIVQEGNMGACPFKTNSTYEIRILYD